MTLCPNADVNAPSKRCEKFGCKDPAACYHVYWYCDRHCPVSRAGDTSLSGVADTF